MSGDQTSELERLRVEKARGDELAKKLEEELRKVREKLEAELQESKEKLQEEMKKSAAKDVELLKVAPAKSDCMAEGSIALEVEVEKMLGKAIAHSPYTLIGGLPCRLRCSLNASALSISLYCNDNSSARVDSAKVTGTVVLEHDATPWCCSFSPILLPLIISADATKYNYQPFIKNGRLNLRAHIKVVYCYKDVIADFASPDPNFTDVTLLVGGKKFNANKMYLAHHAGYFKILFCSESPEKTKKEVGLNDINADDFEEMLRVIYPERKKVTATTVTGLLRMAYFFDAHVLIRECTDFLLETKDFSLAVKLRFTQDFSLPELRDRLVDGMKIDDLKKLINEDSFVLLSEALQKSLLQKFAKLSK